VFHAHRHLIRVFGLGEMIMLIGSNREGHLLEVGIAVADGIEFIVHARPARQKFWR